MLSLIDNNYIIFYKKFPFLSRCLYPKFMNYYNNYYDSQKFKLKNNKEEVNKDNNNINRSNINNNFYLNILNKPLTQDIIGYLNKIKENYNYFIFNYCLKTKRNKTIFYSSLIGISFITLNIGFYIKRKRFENKVRQNLFDIFNIKISSKKIDWEIIRPIINNIIKEKIKSSIILSPSIKGDISKIIIKY